MAKSIYIYLVNGSTKLQETSKSGPRSEVRFSTSCQKPWSPLKRRHDVKSMRTPWKAPGQMSPMASRQHTLLSFLPRAPWAGMSEEETWDMRTWMHANNGESITLPKLQSFQRFWRKHASWHPSFRSHFKRLRELDRAFNTSNSSCNL